MANNNVTVNTFLSLFLNRQLVLRHAISGAQLHLTSTRQKKLHSTSSLALKCITCDAISRKSHNSSSFPTVKTRKVVKNIFANIMYGEKNVSPPLCPRLCGVHTTHALSMRTAPFPLRTNHHLNESCRHL